MLTVTWCHSECFVQSELDLSQFCCIIHPIICFEGIESIYDMSAHCHPYADRFVNRTLTVYLKVPTPLFDRFVRCSAYGRSFVRLPGSK